MAEQNIQVCPFNMHVGEASSVVGADGMTGGIPVSTVPCLGPRCMAFMQVKGEDGQPRGACSRLLTATLLNNIAAELSTSNELKKTALEAQGFRVSDGQHPTKQ